MKNNINLEVNSTQVFSSLDQYFTGTTQIIIGNKNSPNILNITEQEFTRRISYFYKSESFLIEAVRNFVKKTNFSELNEMLNDEEITEEKFESELNQNSDKYLIKLNNINMIQDVQIIKDLVDKIGVDLRDFTTSEISEMFSVNEDHLISKINSLKRHQFTIK